MLFTCMPDDEGGCSFLVTFNREDGAVTCDLAAGPDGNLFTHKEGLEKLEELNPEMAMEIYKGLQELINGLEAGEMPEGVADESA